MDNVECSRKVTDGRRMAGTIKSLVNIKGLSLKCTMILHHSVLLPVLLYGVE